MWQICGQLLTNFYCLLNTVPSVSILDSTGVSQQLCKLSLSAISGFIHCTTSIGKMQKAYRKESGQQQGLTPGRLSVSVILLPSMHIRKKYFWFLYFPVNANTEIFTKLFGFGFCILFFCLFWVWFLYIMLSRKSYLQSITFTMLNLLKAREMYL